MKLKRLMMTSFNLLLSLLGVKVVCVSVYFCLLCVLVCISVYFCLLVCCVLVCCVLCVLVCAVSVAELKLSTVLQ
ncbi:hypothetical protein QTP86_008050 [Hemibagrus guttatus]|nr:hypothetical protein QTP86_008050 [Hemibagrus guttatus]